MSANYQRELLHTPRVWEWGNQPTELKVLYAGKITDYFSASGLYEVAVQGTQKESGDSALFTSLSQTVTAYDFQMLAGITNAATNRLHVDDYVFLLQTSNNLWVIIQPDTIPFLVRKTGDDSVECAKGRVFTLSGGGFSEVASVTLTGLGTGDEIWLGYNTGTGFWTFDSGTLPTDILYYHLVTIHSNTHGKIDKITYHYQGGDIILPEMFPINVTVDTGPPDPPTYGFATLDGVVLLASGGVPINYRDATISYIGGTQGYAFFKADGTLGFFVADEYAAHETKCVAIITAVDGSGCFTVEAAQYSLTKLVSPSDCP